MKIEKAILQWKVTIHRSIKMNKLIHLNVSPSKGFSNSLDILYAYNSDLLHEVGGCWVGRPRRKVIVG